jgi:hypothetical protein
MDDINVMATLTMEQFGANFGLGCDAKRFILEIAETAKILSWILLIEGSVVIRSSVF